MRSSPVRARLLALTLALVGLAAPVGAQVVRGDSLCLALVRVPADSVVQRIACVASLRAVRDSIAIRDSIRWVPRDSVVIRDSIRWIDSTRSDTAKPPVVVDTLKPPPVDSTTPLPTDSVAAPDTLPPPSTGIAELPRALPVVPAGLDQLPCTQTVATGFQTAVGAARGGTVLCLTGAHRGNFTVPARSDSGWIVIRDKQGCPAGRLRPSTYTGARLVSPNNFATLTFKARSHQVLVTCVEITSDSTLPTGPNPLVAIGEAIETKLSDLPTDIALDRVWLHGYANQNVRRAVAGNGHRMSLTRSWCEEIHDGNDSQCWISWSGAGPLLIEDNYLEAASENVMFGGGDPRVPGLVMSDVTIRRNHIAKPTSWLGKKWNVKNLIETKASARVLVEENVLRGSWMQGQVGYAFVLKSTSQNSGCRPCSSSDWTIRRNLIDSVGAGFSIAGQADQRLAFTDTAGVFHPATGTTDSTNRRFDISENWVGALNVKPFDGDGRPIIFTSRNHDIVVRRNVFAGGNVREAILFNTTATWPQPVWNLTLADNVFPRGGFGVSLTAKGEGVKAWTGGASGTSTWTNNAFVGTKPSVSYPSGTTWHASLTSALGVAGVDRALLDARLRAVVKPR